MPPSFLASHCKHKNPLSGLSVFSVPNAELSVMPSNDGKCLCGAGFMQRYSALLEGAEEGDDRSIGSESRRYPAHRQKVL
jgi:hypothetical protein